ncbi:serine protease [Glycomyces sp. NPDC021274]|uniref:S1 family peptidase n=1 Tax=Glycomyces sp. NPDC021274 TaxID=3155120 RepID=UPI0033FF8A18
MNVNPSDPRLARVVKIRVRGPGGFESVVGTGFIVDAGLVLTARHVVKQLISPGGDADRRNTQDWRQLADYPIDMLRICPAEGTRGVEVTEILGLSPTLDVACLVVPGLPSPEVPSPAARHEMTIPLENCWMIGYPTAATDDGSVQAEYVGARLIPVSRNTDGLIALDITTARPTQRDGWKGASGAGTTDVSGNLIGIVSHVPARMEGRLLAVGIPEVVAAARALLTSPEPRTPERQRALEALARLAVTENPQNSNAGEGSVAALAHQLLDAITPILPQPVAMAAQRAHGSISRGRFATGLLVAAVVLMVLLASAVVVRWEQTSATADGVHDPAVAADADNTEAPEPSDNPVIDEAFAVENLFTDSNCASFDLSNFEQFAGAPSTELESPPIWSRTSDTTGNLWCEFIVSYHNEPQFDQLNLTIEVAVFGDSSSADAYREEISDRSGSDEASFAPLEVPDFNGTIAEYRHLGDNGFETDYSETIHEIGIVASRNNVIVRVDMGLEVGIHDIDEGREILIGFIEQAYLMCGYYVVE